MIRKRLIVPVRGRKYVPYKSENDLDDEELISDLRRDKKLVSVAFRRRQPPTRRRYDYRRRFVKHLNSNVHRFLERKKSRLYFFCFQASERVRQNLAAIGNSAKVDSYKKLSSVSKNITSSEGVVQLNPLNF